MQNLLLQTLVCKHLWSHLQAPTLSLQFLTHSALDHTEIDLLGDQVLRQPQITSEFSIKEDRDAARRLAILLLLTLAPPLPNNHRAQLYGSTRMNMLAAKRNEIVAAKRNNVLATKRND
jgi:hypothetical protein